MDKGGDEHLVALQRLEDALNALQASTSAVRMHLAKSKAIYMEKYFLMDWLRVHQSMIANLFSLKGYWPNLSELQLSDLIDFVKQSDEPLKQLADAGETTGTLRKQDVVSALLPLHYPFKQIWKIRLAIHQIRLDLIYPSGSDSPSTTLVDTPQAHLIPGDPEAQRQAEALNLANELRAHGESLVTDFKSHHLATKLPLVTNSAFAALFLFALSGRLVEDRSDYANITLKATFLILIAYFLFQLQAAVNERLRLKESAKARRRLLVAISDYIDASTGASLNPAIKDIIAYAIEHRDNVQAEPSQFDQKTEELKALVASTKSL
ncbi:hypothetical protein CCB81_03925 [Armatimonadetes bacterium Uphvl-Ar2]|nr:hypothetical protein CCB81_03925 [Armatimonadetes bacterium Uphvl-Ar2]